MQKTTLIRSHLAALLLAAAPVGAADMSFTPAAGGGVVIHSAPGAPALAVLPTGEVRLPALPATPATATGAVCHDAAGTLTRCDPLAAVGPKGDTGATGSQGPAGFSGLEVVEHRITPTTLPPGVLTYVAKQCPAGKQAIAGGCEVSNHDARLLRCAHSYPSYPLLGGPPEAYLGWYAAIAPPPSGNWDLGDFGRIYITCINR